MPHSEPDAQALVATTFHLAMMTEHYPHLKRAETKARLRLADAIIRMNQKDEAGEPSTLEQIAVATAAAEYQKALANLVRGEEP